MYGGRHGPCNHKREGNAKESERDVEAILNRGGVEVEVVALDFNNCTEMT
jgi:hypothetical protein